MIDEEQLQDQAITNFLNVLAWLAQSTEPEGQYLYSVLDEFSKQAPSNKKPIDNFFGLDSLEKRGKRMSFTKIQMVRRNQLIVAAIQLLQQSNDFTIWQACGSLSEIMQKFRHVPLERLRSGSRQVSNELEQLLFDIYEIDDDPPTSRDRLYVITKLL